MIWKRSLLLTILVIAGISLETSVFGRLTLAGSKPEIPLLITVALAMGEGPAFGASAGFVLGLMTDVLLQLPQGVSALTFTLIGYLVGRIRAQLQTPSAWLPIVMVSISTFFGVMFYGGFNVLLGQDGLSIASIARHAALASVYNALLTPFLLPLVRGLGARLRPTGVTR